MVLTARKKRDQHKRMMIEADNKAEKEQMIQTLINNKINLYKYIIGNEKEMQFLNKKLNSTTVQLKNLRTENINLKTGLQRSNVQQQAKEKQRAAEIDVILNNDSNTQDNLFGKFFTTLQKARVIANIKQQQFPDENKRSSEILRSERNNARYMSPTLHNFNGIPSLTSSRRGSQTAGMIQFHSPEIDKHHFNQL